MHLANSKIGIKQKRIDFSGKCERRHGRLAIIVFSLFRVRSKALEQGQYQYLFAHWSHKTLDPRKAKLFPFDERTVKDST